MDKKGEEKKRWEKIVRDRENLVSIKDEVFQGGTVWGQLKIKQKLSKEFGSKEVNTDTESKVLNVLSSTCDNSV